jgi:hypothetical protein
VSVPNPWSGGPAPSSWHQHRSCLRNALRQSPGALPGLGQVLGARILDEFRHDRTRYQSAKARRNAAGTSPITRPSGKRRMVAARTARNRRSTDACFQWAFSSLQHSPGAHATTWPTEVADIATSAPSMRWPTAGSVSSTAALSTAPHTMRASLGRPVGTRPPYPSGLAVTLARDLELQVEHRGCRGASPDAEMTVTALPVRRASLALHTYALSPSFEAVT